MDVWGSYNARLATRGTTLREAAKSRESSYLTRKLKASLSYRTATVDGHERQLAIINSDNLNLKTVCTLPGEELLCGSIVEWEENHWIVTETDANNEIYTRGKMLQCNYQLRWVAYDKTIVERWCVVEDGTKYLIGETMSSYNENGMVLGDTRMTVTLPRDEYTVQLNRTQRFLIDDYDSNTVLAYRLSKPYKIGGVYNGHGAMSFVLVEVNTEDSDNFDLHIANYYDYFPRPSDPYEIQPGESRNENGRKVWL